MKYSTSLDWLTMTSKFVDLGLSGYEQTHRFFHSAERNALKSLMNRANFAINNEEMRQPLNTTVSRFYPVNHQFDRGFQLSIGYDENQGVRVVMPSRWLDQYAGQHKELYESYINTNWKLTRCDVAFDFFESGISINRIWSKFIEPTFSGTRKKIAYFQGANGDTIYIGSRQSNFYLRIYDKGREQKSGLDWIRFELEIKKDGCKVLSKQYEDTIRKCASKILGMCKTLPYSIESVLQGISGGAEFNTVYNPEIKSDARKYIESFIIPYIQKHASTEGEILRELYNWMKHNDDMWNVE